MFSLPFFWIEKPVILLKPTLLLFKRFNGVTLCGLLANRFKFLVDQVDSRDVAQLLQSIVFVIDTVLPLLRRPPVNFVEELERDLRQLIVRYSFLTVVHACIK